MAETLREKQSRFVVMVGKLIEYATGQGYELTFADAYRAPSVPYGHVKSLHKHRLAIDLNLFLNGQYLQTTEGHRVLGEWWEAQGGTWGGRFSSPDGNHYSLTYNGMS